ncbi:uncharacterized protein LOC141852029 [Brevipalpus obovatus]|uniref:uncharacterized protein LOC141852029 n=1 Tax=Brevipalpus obovatus TaxID=246614 RepID=UPI003D9E08F1
MATGMMLSLGSFVFITMLVSSTYGQFGLIQEAACVVNLPLVGQECIEKVDNKARHPNIFTSFAYNIFGEQNSACCLMTSFTKCLRDKIGDSCGKEIASLVATTFKTLNNHVNDCGGYSFSDPSCIIVNYAPYIFISLILSAALMAICCCCKCLQCFCRCLFGKKETKVVMVQPFSIITSQPNQPNTGSELKYKRFE